MRIVIDMQGAQTQSRFRGIGRYSMAFAKAVVRQRHEHEIILALSGLFPESIEPIRKAFKDLLPQENIRVWHAPGPVNEASSVNHSRRQVAELMREAFLASLLPDVILVTSLFEGYQDDAVTSVGCFDVLSPVSVILYDLIPLQNPVQYLDASPRYAEHYRRKIEHLRRASAFLAISEFSKQEGIDVLSKPAALFYNISSAIGSEFRPKSLSRQDVDGLHQKYRILRSIILYTGGPDDRKNLPRLIEAFANLPDHIRSEHQLVFAGWMPSNHVKKFQSIATSLGLGPDELVITGYVTDEELVDLYNLCRLHVFPSWHEGFGLPALEAMACGAPVIGSNTSSLPEVIGLQDALFDPLDVASISQKMLQALGDEAFLSRLRAHGKQQIQKFSWDETAKRAICAWEQLPARRVVTYEAQTTAYGRLLDRLVDAAGPVDGLVLSRIAECMAQNQQAGSQRQLLVDVSELCQRDSATGIQRVVRSYLKALLQSPPPDFRVEPVYATPSNGYRYARRFTQRFLGQEVIDLVDEPVRWQRGDVFFGLDLQPQVQLAQKTFYDQLHSAGVRIKFLVYDLLPIELPEFFRDGNVSVWHEQLMAMFARYDGVICISKAVSDAYNRWVTTKSIVLSADFQNDWVHIGADIEGSSPSCGLPEDAQDVFDALASRITFLSVSTLEPRKAQEQILDAVELLWRQGQDVNLVFVGQPGWKVERLVSRIESHAEFGRRLFWLKGISDEYLQLLYKTSTCLIAASINEGFGLPLIEAARYGLPVIARSIPVFQEVAQCAAFYFSGNTGEALASCILEWLNLYKNHQHPDVKNMKWSNWADSTQKLTSYLVRRIDAQALVCSDSDNDSNSLDSLQRAV